MKRGYSRAIAVRIRSKLYGKVWGYAVTWKDSKRSRVSQRVWVPSRADALTLKTAIQAGVDPISALRKAWGLKTPTELLTARQKAALARAQALTPERRKEIAQNAARTRWAKESESC